MTDFIIKKLPYDLSSPVPSSPTLRQRLDAQASAWFDLASSINTAVLGLRINGCPVAFGALSCGYTPIDIDTFAMDNSGTAKELVGRTYAGVDGYCPLAAYLGTAGFCLELALRPGSQHSASESQYNFERVLPVAAQLVSTPLLVRMDSGFCSGALMQEIAAQGRALAREVAFIIKWNPRSTPVESIAQDKLADASTAWRTLRPGKRECLWQEPISLQDVPGLRRIYRLTERTIDKRGQPLLLPEYVLEGWSTTLPEHFDCEQITALYAQHATHEQFHAEFKTDMGLERLPSGKFDTNYLVCQLAAVAMNLLRLIGVHTLHDSDGPVRHSAQPEHTGPRLGQAKAHDRHHRLTPAQRGQTRARGSCGRWARACTLQPLLETPPWPRTWQQALGAHQNAACGNIDSGIL